MANLPLAGIRVLEVGHIIAGPTAGFILGDLGAEVIKIEPPKVGDSMRQSRHGAASYYFLNRNKRSIGLDLRSHEGKEIFLKLVKQLDVVVENYAPGALESLGLGYDRIQRANPRIIYCSIKGFLPGPYERRRSLDEIAQMMGGLAFMTGFPGQPFRAGTSVSDSTAGIFAVLAILAALIQRQETGVGQYIVSGLFESVVFLVGQYMARCQVSGEPSQPLSVNPMGPRFSWAVYDVFDTSDGKQIFIGTPNQKDWEKFCTAFSLQDLLVDPLLQTPESRVDARDWLIPKLREHIAKIPSHEVVERLERIETPYGPVQTPADLKDDPHLQVGDKLLSVRSGDITLRLPSLPIQSSNYGIRVWIDPPACGEHSVEILRELGYSDDVIVDLRNKGVISVP